MIIEELGICRGAVRVDMAVVNGVIHGYEIKSDRDSLRRLAGQAQLYNKVLDKATLVVGLRHTAEALDTIPEWWEVIQVVEEGSPSKLKQVRRGRKNPGRDARAVVELLWLDDALTLLDQRDLLRGARGKPRSYVWDRICQNFSIDEISDAVRANLKARTGSPWTL